MSFALQRFDSLSEPLLKIFVTFPNVLAFLGALTREGDVDDARWSRALLKQLTGEGAYKRVMTAALASDALLCAQQFLRRDDKGDSEVYCKAAEAPG